MSESRELLQQYLTPRRRKALIGLSAACMAAYLIFALAVDAPHITQGLAALGWQGAAVLLGLSLLNYLLRFCRWHWYLDALGQRLPAGRHLAYYIGGFAFTVSPGKVGESVRSVYLNRHGVPYTHSLAALFTERLLDALAVTVLAVLWAAADPAYRTGVIATAVGIGSVVLLAGHGFAPRLLRRIAAPLHGRLHHALGNIVLLLESSARLLQPRYLLPGLVLGLAAWGSEGYGLYFLAIHLDIPLTLWSGSGIYGLAALAGAASFFMPAGLGGMEAAMTALLVAAGATLPAAFAVTVLCRLATLWFAVALGLVALLWVESAPQTES